MSSDLYEVLALAARYLFAILGVLIVLRAFVWLLSDHSARSRTRKKIPFAGTIGEFVVCSDSPDLPRDQVIPVPWEGLLGSVRSCDLFVPEEGVRRNHLSFSFEPAKGLMIKPFSGCEAEVNGLVVTCRTQPESLPLRHGSYLRIGAALLRLRVFAAFDPQAGFDEGKDSLRTQSRFENAIAFSPQPSGFEAGNPVFPPQPVDPSIIAAGLETGYPQAEHPFPLQPMNASMITDSTDSGFQLAEPPFPLQPIDATIMSDESESRYRLIESSALQKEVPAPQIKESRRRRADRWEADWSE